MSKYKKTASLLAVLMFLMSFVGVASAQSDPGVSISPMYTNTAGMVVGLSFDSWGKATLAATIIGQPGTTNISAYQKLERKNADGTYTLVKTFDTVSVAYEVLVIEAYYYVARGYTYRHTLTTTVTRNGTSETVSGYFEAYYA